MKELTPEQALVISGYTGYLVCDFDTLLAEIRRRAKQPVSVTALADKFVFANFVQPLFRKDFISLCPLPKED